MGGVLSSFVLETASNNAVVKRLQDTTAGTSVEAVEMKGGAARLFYQTAVLFTVLFISLLLSTHHLLGRNVVLTQQHHPVETFETTYFNVSYVPLLDSSIDIGEMNSSVARAADVGVPFEGLRFHNLSPQGTNSYAENAKESVRFALYTFYTQSQFELYNLTFINKLSYAHLHHYALLHSLVKQEDLLKYGGFVVCKALREIFQYFPNLEWLMVTGSDHVVMNSAVKIEDLVLGEEASVLVSAEHNIINFGTYFFRNSEKGISFLETMCAATDIYRWHVWYDNQFAIEAWSGHGMLKGVMSMLPQRSFNSYPPGYPAEFLSDSLNCSTLYQRGDFMIHFPGMGYAEKLRSVKTYLSQTERVEGVDPRQRCHTSSPPPKTSLRYE